MPARQWTKEGLFMKEDLYEALQEMRSDLDRITTDVVVLPPNELHGRDNSDLCQDIADNAIKAKEILQIYESMKEK